LSPAPRPPSASTSPRCPLARRSTPSKLYEHTTLRDPQSVADIHQPMKLHNGPKGEIIPASFTHSFSNALIGAGKTPEDIRALMLRIDGETG
jgi:hypothetical protein